MFLQFMNVKVLFVTAVTRVHCRLVWDIFKLCQFPDKYIIGTVVPKPKARFFSLQIAARQRLVVEVEKYIYTVSRLV